MICLGLACCPIYAPPPPLTSSLINRREGKRYYDEYILNLFVYSKKFKRQIVSEKKSLGKFIISVQGTIDALLVLVTGFRISQRLVHIIQAVDVCSGGVPQGRPGGWGITVLLAEFDNTDCCHDHCGNSTDNHKEDGERSLVIFSLRLGFCWIWFRQKKNQKIVIIYTTAIRLCLKATSKCCYFLSSVSVSVDIYKYHIYIYIYICMYV